MKTSACIDKSELDQGVMLDIRYRWLDVGVPCCWLLDKEGIGRIRGSVSPIASDSYDPQRSRRRQDHLPALATSLRSIPAWVGM